MADFPKLLTTFILITLFAFLLVSFAITLGNDYGREDEVSQLEDEIGSQGITNTLDNIEEERSKWDSKFFAEEDDEEKGGFLSTFKDVLDVIGVLAVGVFNLAKNMGVFVFTPFKMFNYMLVSVLEIPKIVATILETLILLAVIFGVWRLIKTGQ